MHNEVVDALVARMLRAPAGRRLARAHERGDVLVVLGAVACDRQQGDINHTSMMQGSKASRTVAVAAEELLHKVAFQQHNKQRHVHRPQDVAAQRCRFEEEMNRLSVRLSLTAAQAR